MATKKQVRRRQKERRHEWEEVYVDDDGNVVEAPEDDEPAAAPRSGKRAQSSRPARSTGRTINPPSWGRVLKRGALFAPLMYVTVWLLAPDGSSVAQSLVQTLFLLLVFLPFSYAMDAMTYRMWRRRTGQTDAGKRA